MKIETETYTTVSSIVLTGEEIDDLNLAYTIIEKMLAELGEADRMSNVIEKIYNNAYDTRDCLGEILKLVDEEK